MSQVKPAFSRLLANRLRSLALLSSYAALNLIVMVLLGRVLDADQFGRLSLCLAVGNLLSVIPGQGVGGSVLALFVGERGADERQALTGLFTILIGWCALLTCTAVLWRVILAPESWLVPLACLLAIASSLYVVGEFYARGTAGVSPLARARLATGSALLLGPLLLYPIGQLSWSSAAVVRCVPLLCVGGFLLRDAAIRRPLLGGKAAMLRNIRSVLGFSVGALSTVGVYSLDKIALKRVFSYAELGRYNLLFVLTVMVGNRCSDLFSSSLIARDPATAEVRWDEIWRKRYLVAAGVSSSTLVMGRLIDGLVLKRGFTWSEVLVFSLASGGLFMSDTAWWAVSVKDRRESLFAFCGVVMSATVAAFALSGVARTSLAMGLVLMSAFLISSLVAEVVYRRFRPAGEPTRSATRLLITGSQSCSDRASESTS